MILSAHVVELTENERDAQTPRERSKVVVDSSNVTHVQLHITHLAFMAYVTFNLAVTVERRSRLMSPNAMPREEK